MRGHLKARRVDFQRRAEFSPESVYLHQGRGIRYIPIHNFGDESVRPSDGEAVDAWCDLPTDVALIESSTSRFSNRPAGIWIRRDEEFPEFLKVMVIVDEPLILRAKFEEVISYVAGHPSAVDGFSSVVPGSPLTPLL